MENVVSGLLAILIGGGMVAFAGKWAQAIVDWYNWFWGFRWGPRQVWANRVGCVLAGMGFMYWGVRRLLDAMWLSGWWR